MLCDDLEEQDLQQWGGGEGKQVRGRFERGTDVCTLTAGSRCCTAEIKPNYEAIILQFFKKVNKNIFLHKKKKKFPCAS